MRFVLFLMSLCPMPLMAETFVLRSQATEAVIYTRLGIVTHEVVVTLPEGTHQIALPDLPRGLALEMMQFDAPELRFGAVRLRGDFAPPRDAPERPEILAVRERIKAITDEIQSVEDAAKLRVLEAEASEARVAFLADLGGNAGLPQDATQLAEIADLVAEQSLAAKRVAHYARLEARREREALKDLRENLARAEAELAALVPEPEDRPLLVVDVFAPADMADVPLRVSYLSYQTSWQPTYDFHLSSGAQPSLFVDRGAVVRQETGENWRGVQLTLSTQDLSAGTDPSVLSPLIRRIFEPKAVMMRNTARTELSAMAEPVIEAPVIVQEADMATQGLALVYAFEAPVDLASGADEVALPFDKKSFDVDLFARAVPSQDEVAYVMARFENTTGEPFLGTGWMRKFFDGGLVGGRTLEPIAPGEQVELGFGQVPGLVVDRVLLDRAEGDRGFISRSNAQEEQFRIDVTNLTDRSWDLELRDRVPVSEQEDLVITWEASPMPDVDGVDDKRGVLQWDLNLAPGAEREVFVRYLLEWPEGMELR